MPHKELQDPKPRPRWHENNQETTSPIFEPPPRGYHWYHAHIYEIVRRCACPRVLLFQQHGHHYQHCCTHRHAQWVFRRALTHDIGSFGSSRVLVGSNRRQPIKDTTQPIRCTPHSMHQTHVSLQQPQLIGSVDEKAKDPSTDRRPQGPMLLSWLTP